VKVINTIYTIGHSSHTIEYFLNLLIKHSINTIVDIRSVPFSKYVPHFNKDTIKGILYQNKTNYVYMGAELGIVQEDKDYTKILTSNQFNRGINRIRLGIEKNYCIAIMCTEKDPVDCHRSLLPSKVLHDNGINVFHILPDGSTETQEEFEKRILNIYFPHTNEQNIFEIINEASYNNENLFYAYRLRYNYLIRNL
jgi:uncharacterized protein (DUF488 family)